jgi:flagellin-like hook-associated protein FlgL
VIQLVNSPSTRLIQDPTGLTFAASLTAQQLFDARDSNGNPTSGNVFSALENLQTALASGDTSAIQTAASGVGSAQDYLNLQSTFYGGVEDRITTALNLAQMFQTQDTAQLSSEQDTDVAAEALQMTQDTTQLDAAMAAAAKQPTTSLFNYFPTTTG